MHVSYTSFGDSPIPMPRVYRSPSHRLFAYTHKQMQKFGEELGFFGSFIGNIRDEDAPIQQRIFKYVAV